MNAPLCPRCKGTQSSRVRREGILHSFILPQLGLFPWECGTCRKLFVARTRGKLRRKRREEGEIHLPPV